MRFSPFLIVAFILFSCGNKSAVDLNNQAMICFQNGEVTKAKQLLDKAIELDPEFSLAYQNKLMVLTTLGEHKQLIETQKKLIKVEPNDPNNLVRLGMFYELKNDTTNSISLYHSADSIFKVILDTLNPETDPQYSIAINRAQNLKLMGRSKEANELLTEIRSKIQPESFREIVDLYLGMNKEEILNHMRQ